MTGEGKAKGHQAKEIGEKNKIKQGKYKGEINIPSRAGLLR